MRLLRPRDHVPSRVLFDEPYPNNLPVVPACRKCNEGFSIDEEYVACLIDCVLSGTVSAENAQREKVRRILSNKPALTVRLKEACRAMGGNIQFSAEHNRIKNLVLKLARGHVLFECNETHYEEPIDLKYIPPSTLSRAERDHFEKRVTKTTI
jgi:hypothetical protein